jgi:hypothetical protein
MYQPPGSNNNGNEGDLGQPSVPGQQQQQIPSLGFFNGQDVATIVASAASQNYGLMGESGGMDDPAQNEIFRLDKQAIYGHPLFPLLSCLLEKCELATCSPSGKNDGSSVCTAASFNEDLEEFVKLKAHEPSFYRPNPELDQVMLLAIRVLRIHLLELEKVHDLCDDFCRKYVSSLKQKIPVDVVNEERTGSGRPPSSMSSPSGTAGSSSSPVVGTPINMPMYPQSYDNHMAPSVDSHTSHNSSHPSNFQNQILDLQKNENPASLASNGHSSTDLTRLSSSSNHNNEMKPGHSHDQSTQDNNGYNSLTDNDYKPQITGLDGSSDAGDESLCDSLQDDGGRDSVSSEGIGGNGSDPTQSSNLSSNGRRKVPKVFSKEAINKFRSWLFQNLSHPYPSEEQKKQLANDTGLTILQVNNWFINARRRIVQPMIDSNNRAGKSPHVNVFKNRRRKNSGSPGPSPDPPSVTTTPSSYNVDTSIMSTMQNTAATAAVAAAATTYPPMFPNPYQMPSFHNPAAGFPPQMFMPMNPYAPAQPWMDLSGGNSSN